MSDVVIHGPWKPRVAPIRTDADVEAFIFGQGGPENFEPPAGGVGGGAPARSSSDVEAGMRAAREADARADAIVRQIFGFTDAKQARDHELQALAAKYEAAAFLIRQLAREAYALKEHKAARSTFDMADILETISCEVSPHDEGGAA